MIGEDQLALVESVRGLLERRADPAAVRTAMASETGWDEELWRTLAEQVGAAALTIPEEYAGAGASLLEAALVLEELGRTLAPSPLLASTIAAAATTDPGLLERIASGEIATVAFADTDATTIPHVLFGAEAAIVLVVTPGGVRLVEPSAREATSPLDPTLRLATLTVDGGRDVHGDPEPARRAALVGVAALAAGCARRGLEMTVDYTKQREQFGRPIGSFQALKHRMADMLVLVEMSRSAAWAAAAGELDPVAAAAYTKDAVARVAAETIQLHGGIAITWEHDAHLVLKRAHALCQLFGQAHELRAELA